MRKMIVRGFAALALGAGLAIGTSARTLKLRHPRTIRKPARKLSRQLSHPTASWRKRFMPVERCAAPLAGQPVAMTTEPRR